MFVPTEPNRTVKPPTVKVLKPSEKECHNKKDQQTQKKTLVCVASGFYPDHVSVTWQVDGHEVQEGVATDGAARRVGDHYRITSRIRVLTRDWLTPTKSFTCTVGFFNGTETMLVSRGVQGVSGRSVRT